VLGFDEVIAEGGCIFHFPFSICHLRFAICENTPAAANTPMEKDNDK
jgi:hypothetical protein